MTPADMARLHAAAFTTPRPWNEAEIAALMAEPFCITLTEERGFLLGRIVACEAEILTLAVDPSARRRGTGQSLVARFLHEAERKGAESVFLEVAAPNLAARALYEKSGFTPRGSRKAYYRDDEGLAIDALVLVREFKIPS
jgi:ribosomal-protein-alanine N-acetyltransferase